jgi:hypothetical protein
MSTQSDQSGGPAIIKTIVDSVSLRIALGGIVLTLISLGLDSTGVIGHQVPPILFIWGIAAIVIGFIAYGLIWWNAPK